LKNAYPFHRFAVSVNRKIGNAVERSYIKRSLREWFRLNRHRVAVQNGDRKFDLWIVVKHRFDKKDMEQVGCFLELSVEKLFAAK